VRSVISNSIYGSGGSRPVTHRLARPCALRAGKDRPRLGKSEKLDKRKANAGYYFRVLGSLEPSDPKQRHREADIFFRIQLTTNQLEELTDRRDHQQAATDYTEGRYEVVRF
jgi:hypothetical protein